MTIEEYLEKHVEIEFKQSNTLVCKGKVVEIYGDNHIYVLPEGVREKANAMGFNTDSHLFDIKIV